MVESLKRSRVFRLLIAVVAISLGLSRVRADDVRPQTPAVLLQMIRDDAVHSELNLSTTQREQIIDVLKTIDGRWFRSRNFSSDRQQLEVETLTEELRTVLDDVLSTQQDSRLGQLERQAMGTRMVLRDDVAESLGLTSNQRQAFADAFVKTDKDAAEIQEQMRSGKTKSEAGNREINRLKAKERQSLVAQLTRVQKSNLGSLTGTPFDFSKVRRMYPLAPELEGQGVTWIQGGPLKLDDLRGKVVAVHFYAFQCINCQRNFPHYKAWHDDFADEDLVIIGIQTPETPSERKLDRVAAAVKSDAMEYPVMLDADSSNWKAWNNTMWPTVYLVDKKGFIRRWWQGEMNWKETPGEKQMRETLKQLLAED